MKRICIDCRMINHSGIGTYIKNIVPVIIEELNQVYFYLLLNRKDVFVLDLKNNLENYEIIVMEAKIFSLQEQIEYLKLIPDNIDLLWVPNFNVPWLYKKRMMVTIHDVFHLAMPEMAGGKLKSLYAKYLFDLIKKRAFRILTVSQFSKQELIKLGKFTASSIHVTTLGVNAEEFRNIPASKSLHSRPYILFVGNVRPNKNILGLVKAFVLIKDSVDFDLVIVGKKEGFINGDRDFMQYYQNASDRIFFTGFVSDNDLKKYYTNAILFVFPSLYEGFGLPLLEAMACGCPVVASNRASLPEVGGNAVLYFDPESSQNIADTILMVAGDDSLRKRMAIDGLEYVKKFSWQNCIKKTCLEIRNIMGI